MISSPLVKKLSLKDYFAIVRKRSWVIAAAVIVVVIYGVLHIALSPNLYRATATIIIGDSSGFGVSGALPPVDDPRFQVDFLTSRTLAKRVSERLGSKRSPGKLLSMVDIKQRKGRSVFEISVAGPDPLEVNRIANAWSVEFINLNAEKKQDFIRKKTENLKEQISEVSGDIAALESELKKRQELMKGLKAEGPERPALKNEKTRYKALLDRVENRNNLLNELLGDMRKVSIAERTAVSNIEVLDKAESPGKLVPRGKKFFPALAAGVLLGIVISFGMEFFDTSLQSAEEVEFYAKMPFLGYVPSVRGSGMSYKEMAQAAHLHPDSQLAEAFRNVKASMIFAAPEEKPLRTIVVSSSVPKEAKSFVASNLAATFSRAKENTLLIDADMRKGKLAGTLDVETKCGLSDVLDGKCGLDEAITAASVPDLSIMSAGTLITNPTDLLGVERFKDAVDNVKSKFQRVIIDVPPVLNFMDILFWGEKCDAMVYVIGGGYTALNDIEEARKKIAGKINIVGSVLNNASVEKDFCYYYHYFESFLEKNKLPDKVREIRDKLGGDNG